VKEGLRVVRGLGRGFWGLKEVEGIGYGG